MPSATARKAAKEPKTGRPIMPALYGMQKRKRGTMKWADVCKQLEKSKNYWICTTRADGRPHAMPVWGFFLDDHLFFSTGRTTLKARNIARDPNIVIHLESGDDAVIVECTVQEFPLTDKAWVKRVDDLSKKKYKMGLMLIPESVMYRATPKVVLAWREKDFAVSGTRWVLE